MKNKIYISIALLSVSLFTANVSRAAFPVKKDATKTEVATQPLQTNEPTATPIAETTEPTPVATTESNVTVKKHSFLSKIFNKIEKAKHAAISQAAYIILAIIGLGWLAMGLNSSFEGADWLISLLLYILFYIPGLIYTIIMMGKYY